MSLQGTVARWLDDRGFGFIRPADGSDELFVHFSSFGGGSLNEGQTVLYDVEPDVRGRPGQLRAANVSGPAVVPRGNRQFGGGGGGYSGHGARRRRPQQKRGAAEM
eukprot:gene8957-3636_t